jgi:hypothetical protein
MGAYSSAAMSSAFSLFLTIGYSLCGRGNEVQGLRWCDWDTCDTSKYFSIVLNRSKVEFSFISLNQLFDHFLATFLLQTGSADARDVRDIQKIGHSTEVFLDFGWLGGLLMSVTNMAAQDRSDFVFQGSMFHSKLYFCCIVLFKQIFSVCFSYCEP